jgi:hypothetical protein
MTSTHLRRAAAAVTVVACAASLGWAADSTSKASSSSGRSTSSTSRTGKGTLPDPVLLDGSTLPVEKKNEQGMIGDFELPGDENARSGKVGGPQGGQGGGGQQKPPGVQVDVPLPGLPIPGGGAGTSAGQQGAGLPQLPQAGGQSGGQQGQSGQQAGGPQQSGGGQNGSNNALGGPGDPNAKADGVQVGQLGGEGSSQDSLAIGEKPPPVAIGDSAMRIQTSGSAAGVVGAQQVGVNTQQVEKATGSGGKGTGGATGGPNRSEKGRTMPAGL